MSDACKICKFAATERTPAVRNKHDGKVRGWCRYTFFHGKRLPTTLFKLALVACYVGGTRAKVPEWRDYILRAVKFLADV